MWLLAAYFSEPLLAETSTARVLCSLLCCLCSYQKLRLSILWGGGVKKSSFLNVCSLLGRGRKIFICPFGCTLLLLFWRDYVGSVPTLGMGGFPFVERNSLFTASLSGSFHFWARVCYINKNVSRSYLADMIRSDSFLSGWSWLSRSLR